MPSAVTVEVLCLIQVRNDARYLRGFLHHIGPHVDAIVALDDCSTDATPEILRCDPKVVSILRETGEAAPHANEVKNRHRLMVEAARLGGSWVLCADADERLEENFLRRLSREARRGDMWGRPVRCVRVLNLWNGRDQYRVDGRCGPRFAPRMFRLPRAFSRRPPGMHQPWFPPELDGARRVNMDANLYHLRMIDPEDRVARFRKFKAVDPDGHDQAIGYDHLVDERGLTLKPVPRGRGYVDLPAVASPAETAARVPLLKSGGRPREWCRLTGLDFDATFRALRTGPP